MTTRDCPYYELQRQNPFRKPRWRWDRANDLVKSGCYYSKKRDDVATGIAVAYLRDTARCYSELRLRRVRDRYEHVHEAKQLWEDIDGRRLEIDARILARQNDVEIGLATNLPAVTIRAYADLFYDIRGRIDSTSYILFEVIGLRPPLPPSPAALMKSSAYFHGPAIIEPWLQYLGDGPNEADRTSAAGRLMANIDYFVAAHTLPDNAETRHSLVKLAPILMRNGSNSSKSVSAAKAFSESTLAIMAGLDLPDSVLPPFSYAPADREWRTDGCRTRQRKDRKAA